MKKTFTKKIHKNVDYEAIVSLEELKNGLRLADIVSCDDVYVEAFLGKCKVQILRDGHIIIHELPKRVKNKAIFRDDNSSFTLGRDGKYYFVFTMPEQLVNEIPYQLQRQAAAIAGKIEEALALKR
jgi:hypothetical protein